MPSPARGDKVDEQPVQSGDGVRPLCSSSQVHSTRGMHGSLQAQGIAPCARDACSPTPTDHQRAADAQGREGHDRDRRGRGEGGRRGEGTSSCQSPGTTACSCECCASWSTPAAAASSGPSRHAGPRVAASCFGSAAPTGTTLESLQPTSDGTSIFCGPCCGNGSHWPHGHVVPDVPVRDYRDGTDGYAAPSSTASSSQLPWVASSSQLPWVELHLRRLPRLPRRLRMLRGCAR